MGVQQPVDIAQEVDTPLTPRAQARNIEIWAAGVAPPSKRSADVVDPDSRPPVVHGLQCNPVTVRNDLLSLISSFTPWVLCALLLPACLGKMSMTKREKLGACAPKPVVNMAVNPLEQKVSSDLRGDDQDSYELELREFVKSPEKSGTTETDESEACFDAEGEDCVRVQVTRIFYDGPEVEPNEYHAYLPSAAHIDGTASTAAEALKIAIAKYQKLKGP